MTTEALKKLEKIEEKIDVTFTRQEALAEAVAYFLTQVTERPELAHLMCGTESLSKMIKARSLVTSEDPEKIKKAIQENVNEQWNRHHLKKIMILEIKDHTNLKRMLDNLIYELRSISELSEKQIQELTEIRNKGYFEE